jgi:hypothetical protein
VDLVCDSPSFLDLFIVLNLPGFQKGRDIKASYGKGLGAVLIKKGQFASYKEKLEKWTEFHYFYGQ